MAATDVVLDAMALVECRLRGDGEGLAIMLGHCGSHRAVAVVLADAQHLESTPRTRWPRSPRCAGR